MPHPDEAFGLSFNAALALAPALAPPSFQQALAAAPTALVGLTVVPGAASTFMRSDAAPALDQGIVPTWTGIHTHSNDVVPNASATRSLGSAAARWLNLFVSAISDGASSELLDSTGTTVRVVRGTAWTALQFGNATSNPSFTFLGNKTPTHGGSQLIQTSAALTNNAAAAAATITNGPIAGNPTKWIPINDNGTVRNIPAW